MNIFLDSDNSLEWDFWVRGNEFFSFIKYLFILYFCFLASHLKKSAFSIANFLGKCFQGKLEFPLKILNLFKQTAKSLRGFCSFAFVLFFFSTILPIHLLFPQIWDSIAFAGLFQALLSPESNFNPKVGVLANLQLGKFQRMKYQILHQHM